MRRLIEYMMVSALVLGVTAYAAKAIATHIADSLNQTAALIDNPRLAR